MPLIDEDYPRHSGLNPALIRNDAGDQLVELRLGLGFFRQDFVAPLGFRITDNIGERMRSRSQGLIKHSILMNEKKRMMRVGSSCLVGTGQATGQVENCMA